MMNDEETDRMMIRAQSALRRSAGIALLAAGGVLASSLVVPFDAGALTGRIVVAGSGPEQPIIQDLARAFEKLHPGAAIDIEWDKTVRAVELVKTGEAQVAVTDRPEPALDSSLIAWDGIAVVVNFANPLGELTSDQVGRLFTGRLTRWSELDGADKPVELVVRTAKDNLTAGYEASLGIAGKLAEAATVAKSDQQTLRLVSGRDAAISYMSLGVALRAQEDGVPIRVLTIDHVEPGEPTVASGRYPLKRPVLLLTALRPDPLTVSFISFARSAAGQPLVRPLYTPVGSSSALTLPLVPSSPDTPRPAT